MFGTVDTDRNRALRFIGALLCALVAFLSFVSIVSYLVSWRQDQSMLGASHYWTEAAQFAENRAGSLGYLIGYFLVDRCIGLASFIPCIVLLVLAVRMFRNLALSWGKTAAYLLLASLLTSVTLGFVAAVVPANELSNMFGGGIGGGCGSFLAASLNGLVGEWGAGAFLLCCWAVFAYLTSPRFEKIVSSAMTLEQHEAEEEDIPAVAGFDELRPADETLTTKEAQPVDEFETMDEFALAEDRQPEESVDEPQTDEAVDEDVDVSITGPEEVLSTDIEEELPRLDIRSELDRYSFPPPLDLLEDYADKRYSIPKEEVDGNIEKIKTTLASFKIPVQGINASVGYTVTLYRISLGEGVRVNTVRNLEDDIAIKIGIKGVRVVMLSDAVGIEVPNQRPSVVPLKAILNSDAFRNIRAELPVALGYTIMTKAKVFDLADAPHLLVAGATKQGKSVGLNAIISSLLYSKHPTELKFVFIDPKMVEFQKYSKLLKHYLALLPPLDGADEADSAIVKDPKSAESVLRSLCVEMDQRYVLLSAAGVNKVTDYNEKFRNRHLRYDDGHHFMPYLVVVVDEYADLTKSGNDRNLSRSIENSINRLAAKGRAAGLHVIIATQRPSVDVITGTIKGNFPTRMAFRTAQRQDSQTILGIPGAEKLIGKGDMLFFTGADAERVQCALVDTDEIERLTSYIADQSGYRQCCSRPYYLPDPGDMDGSQSSGENGGLIDMKNLDSMFEEAAKLVVMNGGMSTTMLQRKLQLGFARAGRIMDQLEAAGVVGPQQGARPREALVSDLASLQSILDAYVK